MKAKMILASALLVASALLAAFAIVLTFNLPTLAQDKTPLGVTVGLSTTQIKPGEWVGVSALVSNPTDRKANFKIEFSSVGPCGDTAIGYGRYSVGPHRSIAVSVGYPTSVEACAGEYTVTAKVESGGTEAKADVVLIVE